MGSSQPKGSNATGLELDDDDDFFGGGGFGGKQKDDTKKKSAKVESNDPLAFLKRAENEKQNAAQKKAMRQ